MFCEKNKCLKVRESPLNEIRVSHLCFPTGSSSNKIANMYKTPLNFVFLFSIIFKRQDLCYCHCYNPEHPKGIWDIVHIWEL